METKNPPTSPDTPRTLPLDDGRHFVGRWEVIAGNMLKPCDPPPAQPDPAPKPKQFAVIQAVLGTKRTYRLCNETIENGIVIHKPLQTLDYHPDSGMLMNHQHDRGRCIAFWDRGASRAIFAMRKKTQAPGDPTGPGLYPWENEEDDGSWGAEEEPPLNISS